MANKKEEELKLLRRIYLSPDGDDFVQLLTSMLQQNHKILLLSTKENRDELIGYGRCLLDIIKDFQKSVEKDRKFPSFDL